jgi:predicted nucleotide-binding protein
MEPRTAATAAVIEAADKFGRASSGSNFGYHSCIYYRDFQPPPPGAHFSSEWGFIGMFQGTTGDWVEYNREEVTAAILTDAGSVDLKLFEDQASNIRMAHETAKETTSSIISAYLQFNDDAYLARLKSQIEAEIPATDSSLARSLLSRFSGTLMSRDTVAIGQGIHLAPHEVLRVQATAIDLAYEAAHDLTQMIRRAADHIERLAQTPPVRARQVGTRVFIGHGRSLLWRELKDFTSDRLGLPYDEFNRVPVAGTTNIDRLSEMLDNAAIAFLVLTAEDEKTDGTQVARQNVVHEAGLFQGRLGFSRAIIMVEEGCALFSNIDGLGQLRFPAGRISAVFEDVRLVLERESLVEVS